MINQSEFIAITCNWLKAWEKNRADEVRLVLVFSSQSLVEKWCGFLIFTLSVAFVNRVITFTSHLRTALFTEIAPG